MPEKRSTREREYIERLKRRRDFLRKRLSERQHEGGDHNLHEANALTWVLKEIGEEDDKVPDVSDGNTRFDGNK